MRDSSIHSTNAQDKLSLGLTKRTCATLFVSIGSIWIAFAQESPTPSPSPSFTQTPIPSPSVARTARIHFVPPPMEGTFSLGIFDSNKKLVRVLHREAKIDDFTIDETSLTTTWDGKNDAGEDLPPGKYHARGYLVGHLKVEEVSSPTPPPAASSDHISVKLVINPLLSDVRSVVDLGVGSDANGSFLRTMDNLPLWTVSTAPNLARVSIARDGEKSADIWQEDNTATKEFRISNIDKMMAFDCGDFELK